MFYSVAFFVFALCAAVAACLVYVRRTIFTHWQRLGFPVLPPHLPFGNLTRTILRQTSFGLNMYELYQQATTPLVGIYLLWRPALLVRCPQLAHRVLTIDFAHFHDRGMYSRPHEDPISDNLFAMEGQRWRQMRAHLTPIFTAGRLRGMLPTLLEKGDNLVRALEPAARRGEVVDMKDFVSRYITSVCVYVCVCVPV